MPEENEGTEGTEGTEGGEEELTPEELKAALEEARQENEELKKSAAKKRTEAARAAKAAKNKGTEGGSDDETPAEKAARERAEAAEAKATALEQRVARAAAEKIAAGLGALDAEDVILNLEARGVDLTDEDEVKIAARDLLKAKPHLKKPPAKTDAGEGGDGGPGSRTMNQVIRAAAGRS